MGTSNERATHRERAVSVPKRTYGAVPTTRRAASIGLPLLALAGTLGAWEVFSRTDPIRTILIPPPSRIAATLVEEFDGLFSSLLVTLTMTVTALALAVVGGVGLAVLFSRSRLIEATLFPFAVVLQVTPIIAIAPLIIIYVDDAFVAGLICAWIVAFFPILSNTALGLRSADRRLDDLFTLYGAGRGQRLRRLNMPAALPYFLGGLRIAGGLALIGAVVAEFVIGASGEAQGLAARILEASYRLQYAKMFAALALIMIVGVSIFLVLTAVTHFALRRWHESASRTDR